MNLMSVEDAQVATDTYLNDVRDGKIGVKTGCFLNLVLRQRGKDDASIWSEIGGIVTIPDMYAWARGILHRGDDSENGDEGELDDRELADALEYLVSICPGVHLLSGRSFVLVTIESIVGLLEQAFSKLLINRSDELAQKSAYKSTSSTKISPAIVALAEMMRSISTEAEDKKDSRFTHDITTWTKEDFIAAIEDCFGGNGIVLRLGQPSWADSAAFARAHLITELLRDGGEVEKMITENGRWKIPTVEESLQQALSKLDLEEEAEEAAKKVKKSKKKRAAKKATVP